MREGQADRFDEIRRTWIAAHQGFSIIQRRRAELLGCKVRARQRAVASAVPDPHDDTVIPPLWLRATNSPASQLELLVVLGAAMLVPLGWLAGWAFKQLVTRLVPGTLCAYPIAAMLWAGAGLEFLVITLYDPAPGLGQTILTPWLCTQLAAAVVIAGLYGIAEGWLAVSGSAQWWPLTPPRRSISAADAASILGGYDTTGPALLDAQPLRQPGERTRS